jgi:predicted DsbA family dithiol-disulfide isomerase
MEYAAGMGKQTEVAMALFEANFGKCQDVSDHETLLSIAAKVGMDIKEVQVVLDAMPRRKELQEREDYWKNKGVSVVPTMIFNKQKVLNGAYSVHEYKQILQELFSRH